MKGKGFGDWVEIFKGGKQIDSEGKPHDGDALIDRAVETFNPDFHEPALVIGHPKHDDPAYGWIAGVKTVVKDGVKTLLMKAKDVAPEFEEAVKSGRFKKRSAKFYKDGRLKHVGFLGGKPPAVKGLANIAFAEGEDGPCFEFSEDAATRWTWNAVARMFRAIRDYIIEKDGKEAADAVIPEWNIDQVREEEQRLVETTESAAFGEHINPNKGGNDMSFKEKFKGMLSALGVDTSKVPDDALPASASFAEGTPGALAAFTPGGAFTQADLDKAASDAKAAAEAEFSEKEVKRAKTARDAETAQFCETLIKDGQIPPSWKDAGLIAFMQGLDAEEEIAFAEGDNAEKKTGLDWMKEFLGGFGKSAIFQEMATKESAAGDSEFAEGEAIDADLTMKV